MSRYVLLFVFCGIVASQNPTPDPLTAALLRLTDEILALQTHVATLGNDINSMKTDISSIKNELQSVQSAGGEIRRSINGGCPWNYERSYDTPGCVGYCECDTRKPFNCQYCCRYEAGLCYRLSKGSTGVEEVRPADFEEVAPAEY